MDSPSKPLHHDLRPTASPRHQPVPSQSYTPPTIDSSGAALLSVLPALGRLFPSLSKAAPTSTSTKLSDGTNLPADQQPASCSEPAAKEPPLLLPEFTDANIRLLAVALVAKYSLQQIQVLGREVDDILFADGKLPLSPANAPESTKTTRAPYRSSHNVPCNKKK
jgi:hypothetical protein